MGDATERRPWDAVGRIERPQGTRVPDAELVGYVREGHALAFHALMQRYEAIVSAYVHSHAPRAADAESLIQDVFLAAYARLGSLRDPARFGPWLLRVARNRCIDALREKAARPTLVPLDAAVHGHAVPQTGPDGTAAAEEIVAAVIEAIEGLSERYRVVVYLRIIAEESPQEIALQLGLKESTVRMRLMRGLRVLRATLGPGWPLNEETRP